jgi:hypothetical protein
MLAVRSLIQLPIGKQLLSAWRPIVSVILMALIVRLTGGTIAGERDHLQLVLWLAQTSVIGALVYGGMLYLLWYVSGRPDGIETKVMEFLSIRFGNATGKSSVVNASQPEK